MTNAKFIRKNLEMDAKIELITPEVAKEYLNKNTSNRKINKDIIEQYVNAMRSSQWIPNGDTIKFSNNDKLMDGQHRLSAIISSGKSYNMVVIRGLPEEVFKTIDTGKKRNRSDVLHIAGFSNVAALAGALRLLFLFEKIKFKNIYPSLFRGGYVSNEDILNIATKTPDMGKTVTTIYSEYKYVGRLMGTCPAICLFYIFSKKDPKLAREYYSGLQNGINLSEDSVIRNVREKLISNLLSNKKLDVGNKISLVIRSWNFLRQGVREKRLISSPNVNIAEIL